MRRKRKKSLNSFIDTKQSKWIRRKTQSDSRLNLRDMTQGMEGSGFYEIKKLQ